MNPDNPIILPGAERQGATSFALAYPDRPFIFVSEHPVVDGWDLPNVSFLHLHNPKTQELLAQAPENIVPLSTEYIQLAAATTSNNLGTFDVLEVMNTLHQRFPQTVLPLHTEFEHLPRWIMKGNHYHKPDATELGGDDVDSDEEQSHEDVYGCGLIYQEHHKGAENYMVTGIRNQEGGIGMGIMKVFGEACARVDILIAGETQANAAMQQTALDILQALDHKGHFNINIIQKEGKHYVTSMRPVPKAFFQTYLRADLDLLNISGTGVKVAAPGSKFIGDIVYTNYQTLEA